MEQKHPCGSTLRKRLQGGQYWGRGVPILFHSVRFSISGTLRDFASLPPCTSQPQRLPATTGRYQSDSFTPGSKSEDHMAKVELGAPFQRFTGKIGKLSYRWMYGKQTVMKTPISQRSSGARHRRQTVGASVRRSPTPAPRWRTRKCVHSIRRSRRKRTGSHSGLQSRISVQGRICWRGNKGTSMPRSTRFDCARLALAPLGAEGGALYNPVRWRGCCTSVSHFDTAPE